MSARWDGEVLLKPITADQPCGQSLDGTLDLLAFEALNVFGESRRLDGEPEKGDTRKLPDWRAIKEKALGTLVQSKDLRVLAHLGAALLRTDGVPAFASTLTVAGQWFESHFNELYPGLADNERLSAINCYADYWAIIDGLRRAPLVISRQHGRISLRALDVLTGQVKPATDDVRVNAEQVKAAFAEMPLDDLQWLVDSVTGALKAVASIEKSMREASEDAIPEIEALSKELARVERVARVELALRLPVIVEEAIASSAESATKGVPVNMAMGSIASREDAVRALEAVSEFFRRNEPSSPVPLLLDRATRLVSKSFLDVLADIAPNAVEAAQAVGGLKKSQ